MGLSLGAIGGLAGAGLGFALGGPMGAAVGASLGGSIGGASDASKAASEASARAAEARAAELDFAKAQYADWKDIYGGIESNVADFYQALDPDKVTAARLTKQQAEFTRASDELNRSFSQRGIDSPVIAMFEQQQELAQAESRAQIRYETPFDVAREQSGFVAGGRGAQANAINNVSTALRGETGFYNSELNRARANEQDAGNAVAGAIGQAAFAYGSGVFNPVPTAGGNTVATASSSYASPGYVPPGGSFPDPNANFRTF